MVYRAMLTLRTQKKNFGELQRTQTRGEENKAICS